MISSAVQAEATMRKSVSLRIEVRPSWNKSASSEEDGRDCLRPRAGHDLKQRPAGAGRRSARQLRHLRLPRLHKQGLRPVHFDPTRPPFASLFSLLNRTSEFFRRISRIRAERFAFPRKASGARRGAGNRSAMDGPRREHAGEQAPSRSERTNAGADSRKRSRRVTTHAGPTISWPARNSPVVAH